MISPSTNVKQMFVLCIIRFPLLFSIAQVFHAITKLVLKTKKAATANAPQPKKDTTIKVGGNRGGGQKSKKCC